MSLRLTKEDENKSGETPDLLLEGNYSPVGQASRLSKKGIFKWNKCDFTWKYVSVKRLSWWGYQECGPDPPLLLHSNSWIL